MALLFVAFMDETTDSRTHSFCPHITYRGRSSLSGAVSLFPKLCRCQEQWSFLSDRHVLAEPSVDFFEVCAAVRGNYAWDLSVSQEELV